jgi:hypothetical protein
MLLQHASAPGFDAVDQGRSIQSAHHLLLAVRANNSNIAD